MQRRRLLALETSGKSGSVAVATATEDGSLAIHQEILDPAWGSARTLAPAIARLLEGQELDPGMIDAIAVVQGPGSFTGLRVGAATAKAMAWALRIPLIAVDALDCVAHQVACAIGAARATDADSKEQPPPLVVVADAYRGQVFVAQYAWQDGTFAVGQPTGLQDIENLCRGWWGGSQGVLFAGPGVAKIRRWRGPDAAASAHPLVQFLEGPESTPMATTVARLGWLRWERGETEDAMAFLPQYYRGSAAEEKGAMP